ncbi:MAG: helix-hairpin-helix domain-containing protein [Methylophilaceae bacterium]|nr:helix-hairpin-helix domain-containing protein [Methylophilaceae bacterium]
MKKFLLACLSACVFILPAYAAIDLNTATEAELQTIKGIGPAKAKAIVEYRKQHGEFKSTDDLEKVPGFGKKSVEKIRKDITVGNARAAAAGKTADLKSVKEDAKVKVKEKAGKH